MKQIFLTSQFKRLCLVLLSMKIMHISGKFRMCFSIKSYDVGDCPGNALELKYSRQGNSNKRDKKFFL